MYKELWQPLDTNVSKKSRILHDALDMNAVRCPANKVTVRPLQYSQLSLDLVEIVMLSRAQTLPFSRSSEALDPITNAARGREVMQYTLTFSAAELQSKKKRSLGTRLISRDCR